MGKTRRLLTTVIWGGRRLNIAVNGLETITRNGWSKQQWKSHCREEAAWWLERQRLFHWGIVPGWESTCRDVDRVIGKYREQSPAWTKCCQIAKSVFDRQLTVVQATDQYEALVKEFPDFAPCALYCRAVMMFRSDKDAVAIRDLDRVLSLDEKLSWAYYFRSACHFRTGQNEKAEKDRDEAFRRMPKLRQSFEGKW
jgi:tetratricopeptide (TPR) repeat protein